MNRALGHTTLNWLRTTSDSTNFNKHDSTCQKIGQPIQNRASDTKA